MVIRTHASAKSPHMIVFSAVAAGAALSQIIFDEQPQSVIHAASPTWGVIWSAICAFGGIMIIVGAYWRDAATGLFIESAGHAAIIVGYTAYSVVLAEFMTATWYTSTVFLWGLAFIVASSIRWFMIQKVIRKAQRASKAKASLDREEL